MTNEEAIELLDNLIGMVSDSQDNDYDTALKMAIEALKQTAWIPCSERLPNTNGCYLVWRPHFFGGDIGMSSICYFDGSDTWHDSYGVDFTRILNKGDVTAWMPLPEPWKGEQNE